MKKYIKKTYDSPTFMTWGSFLVKSLSLVIVLPLILTRLTTAEISLWYLFMTIIGMQLVVDAGFSPTFTRIIAYAMGGATLHDLKQPNRTGIGNFDKKTLNCIYSTMKTVFINLGIFWGLLLIIVGTIALIKPIGIVPDSNSAWFAWVVIVIVSFVSFQGNLYSAYLQGVNQVALFRRWDALTSLGGIVSSFLVLIFGGGLLELVLAHQGWQLVSVICNRWLARKANNRIMCSFIKEPFSREVYDVVWPSAWRSGLGIFMSYGLIQASGIIYAQIGNAASVAAYLLGLRLIQTIMQFSQAPFYSKLPLFARLYAENRRDELVRLAKGGMSLAHWIYVACFIGLGLIGEPLLEYIGSNAPFPDTLLWSLLGFGFFVERYGAMHIQLYSTINHIVWHTANGGAGTIYIIASLILYGKIGVLAFPVGIILGYAGFYAWYAAIHSYREFKMDFFSFEKGVTFFPLVALLTYVGLSLAG